MKSKRFRNKIYRSALKYLITHDVSGLCAAIKFCKTYQKLSRVTRKLENPYTNNGLQLRYPEIYAQKPVFTFEQEYWFSPWEKEERITILRKAIKQTNSWWRKIFDNFRIR